MPHVFPHCMTAATAQLSVLVYTDAIMTLLNFVSSKRFSLLSHTDLEIQRGEARISWVIFKNHLLEVCIIRYCKNKEGERLHYTLTGPYQNNFCFFVLFFFQAFHSSRSVSIDITLKDESFSFRCFFLCSHKSCHFPNVGFHTKTCSPQTGLMCWELAFVWTYIKTFWKYIIDFPKLEYRLKYIVWSVTFTCPLCQKATR